VHGYESFQTAEVVAGSLIVAVVALALELTFATVQKLIDPMPVGSR
jgi:ABC-type proline/glycine betaine transport system permease subunit